MTIVLALTTSDGLVIASDSQITDSDRGLSFPAQKLHDLGGRAAWGGSGARSVLTDVARSFDEDAAAILDADPVTHALQDRFIPVLRHHYENFIADVPGEDSKQSPSAHVLVAGYSGVEPWIVEINPNGMVSRFDDIGFHAIGSGAPMAQQAGALLAHFRVVDRSIDHGVVAAVRVLDALRVTSPQRGWSDRCLPCHRKGHRSSRRGRDLRDARARRTLDCSRARGARRSLRMMRDELT